MRYLIVGIDPGTTTAYAALDLDGGVISIRSSRGYGEKELLEELRGLGKPVVVATDKEAAPGFVRKIASRLNAKLFSPDHNLGVHEKKHLVTGHGVISHEKDALAAAIFIYRSYESLFKKINLTVPRKSRDEVKKKLLLNEAVNIQDALREKVEKKKEIKKQRKRVGEDELSQLKQSNYMLRKRLSDLEESLKETELRFKSASRGISTREDALAEERLRTIRQLSGDIKSLKDKLETLRKKNRILSMGGVPLGEEVIVSGRKVVVGEGNKPGIIYVNNNNLKVLEETGIDYVSIKDIERHVAQKVVKEVISNYKEKHQMSKT